MFLPRVEGGLLADAGDKSKQKINPTRVLKSVDVGVFVALWCRYRIWRETMDPQEVHGAECPYCLEWQFDNQEDFAQSGRCWTCEEVEPEDSDEDASDVLTQDNFFKKVFG